MGAESSESWEVSDKVQHSLLPVTLILHADLQFEGHAKVQTNVSPDVIS